MGYPIEEDQRGSQNAANTQGANQTGGVHPGVDIRKSHQTDRASRYEKKSDRKEYNGDYLNQ